MHTPGPWFVERLGSIIPWTDALTISAKVERGGIIHIAHTTRGFEGDGTECDSSAQANAKLIAAAPELLDACKFAFAAMNSEEGRDRAKDALISAIHKATV